MKRITVIGGGSNGMATAAYFSLKGHAVTLCDTAEQMTERAAIEAQGGVVMKGAFGAEESPVAIARITDDFAAAVADAESVVVCVSVPRHEEIAHKVCPHLKEGQTLVFNPGNMAAVRFAQLYPQLLETKGLVMAEVSGCLWACRITGAGEITVALPPKAKKVAGYPADMTQEAVARVNELFEAVPAKNVLEAALNSPNVITHLAGTIYNVAQVEKMGEDFAFFAHGMSDTVVRTFCALEEERNAVLRAAGLAVYEESSEGFMRTLMNPDIAPQFNTFRALKGPSSMEHRYMAEDALCGVPLLVSLAEKTGVPATLTGSFLNVASCINGRDYYKEGYTLQNLGFEPKETA